MSDNQQNPGPSRRPQDQDQNHGPLVQPQPGTHEDDSPSELPTYEHHISQLQNEETSAGQSYHQGDVKPSSLGWPSEQLSQIPTARSEIQNYSTGIPSPTATGSSLSHLSSYHIPVEPDINIETAPPPAYSEIGDSYLEIDQNGLSSKARILDDGRIDISINQRSRRFSTMLLPALTQTLSQIPPQVEAPTAPELEVPRGLQGKDAPKLNIVIQIIGSRGDVQPFVALGKVLKNNPPYHRVRIATHPTFHKFVEENDLEFFSIGGDPAELMAFMVKNPGLMPGWDSLKQGDVGKRRKAMYEMLLGCWKSCIEGGNGLTPQSDLIPRPGEESLNGVFIADAIIANPPSFAHIHCAERLAIPLHIMFTMPWTPTQSFPHPLANIKSSNTEANITNFLTYTMVEMMTWQGLGDLVNKFREKTLGLDPVSTMWAPGMIPRLKVPHTYCWSPALIPKPQDWGPHIKISGFYFLDLANNYTPAADLAAFLDAGPPPVYIGFGSIVVDDPNHLTNMIFEAVRITGVRALVSKGWGGLGGDALTVPDGVFMLGNCPHDWLFKKVACVVHHGGAGTTAIGVALGKPTVVVPFFGDQPFWGSMVNRAGAGPPPVPFKELTAEKLAESIKFAMSPEAQTAAGTIADKIKQESGTVTGSDSFHASLEKQKLKCLVDPRRAAVWRIKRTEVRLSTVAAAFLQSQGLLYYSDLKLCRNQEWQTSTGPIEPISGATSALLGTIGSVMMGVGDFPKEIFRAAKQVHTSTKSETASTAETSSIASAASASVTSITSTVSTPTPTSAGPTSAPSTSARPTSAPQSIHQSTRSGSATPSRKASSDSMRDSEITSLSSYESDRRLTKDLPELPILPPPPPLPSNSGQVGRPTEAAGIQHTSSNPETASVSSHRSAMGSALNSVHRSRSNSPMSKLRRSMRSLTESAATTPSPGDDGSASPHHKRLHKERSLPVEGHASHKLHKERTSHSTSEASGTMTPISGTPSQGTTATQKGGATVGHWIGAGKGAGRIAGAMMKSPLDFTLALAQGFHNAPLLYGDSTVRKQEKITGMGSGLKVAGKEFALGIYDGVSGLVTQPVQGAKEEGHAGFWKGVGKGVGGLVLKPSAAVMGMPGYTFKGIYEEIRRHSHTDINGFVVSARIMQGIEELKTYNQAELDTMLKRWNALNVERVKGKVKHKADKGKDKEKKKRLFSCPNNEVSVQPITDEAERREEDIEDAPENRYNPTIHSTFDQETMESLSRAAGYPAASPVVRQLRAQPFSPQQQQQQRTLEGVENHDEIERAIQESVRQTSRGDAEEDRLIEQAIRTSLAEVANQAPDEDDELVLKRAITASMDTANPLEADDEAHMEMIERAITRSLSESHAPGEVDPDELARAIEESKNVVSPQEEAHQDLELALKVSRQEEERRNRETDDDLQKVLEMSKREEEEKNKKEQADEEELLKHVMRMSMAEQKHVPPSPGDSYGYEHGSR
ncbi:hypothetical protein AA313_de0206202 [Arthrobotrys entomopaga]|nr:hypothetical protein AA313_de0206202 [Arthrobotrys entomopaga]